MNRTTIILGLYLCGQLATWVFLTFFDNYQYTWWNWIVAVPANFILGAIWPIYWLILLPLLGH